MAALILSGSFGVSARSVQACDCGAGDMCAEGHAACTVTEERCGCGCCTESAPQPLQRDPYMSLRGTAHDAVLAVLGPVQPVVYSAFVAPPIGEFHSYSRNLPCVARHIAVTILRV
jgi:hypothetical protein